MKRAFPVIGFVTFLLVTSAQADTVCSRVTTKLRKGKAKSALTTTTVTSGAKCPRGYTALVDTSTFVGATGATGPAGADGLPGADGQLRIYGSGSAGEKVITGDTILADDDLQYTNFTVSSGVTLGIRSGTVIRCSGSFVNNGTITVFQSARPGGSTFSGTLSAGELAAFNPPHPGIARSIAGFPAFGDASEIRHGGLGAAGFGISASSAPLLNPGPYGGGGSTTRWNSTGASGGGIFVVLAREAIVNNGTIVAAATSASVGSGGGGGGIVVLASSTSVVNGAAGFISAAGGDGGSFFANNPAVGPGGGGGGGLIQLFAPTVIVTTPSNLTVNGGAVGAGGTVTGSPRSGGGAGGGCMGGGGHGGSVATNGVTSGATAGEGGTIRIETVDPTSLL